MTGNKESIHRPGEAPVPEQLQGTEGVWEHHDQRSCSKGRLEQTHLYQMAVPTACWSVRCS